METRLVKWVLVILTLTCLFLLGFASSSSSIKKTYIVQMDNSAMPLVFSNHLDWYSYKLNSLVAEQSNDGERIIYTYQNAFHGLAAHLTDEEASQLAQDDAVLSLFPDTVYKLHTTRTPMFLGLNRDEVVEQVGSRAQNPVHDVIVGVLDTGIWPESQSFNDSSMGPVPARWKGSCEAGRGFDPARHCNRKIVGARVFYRGYEAATGKIDEDIEYKSPRDQDGHGSHTAGTVAGSAVHGASLLGYAQGTARGMHPEARVAAYKVCWAGGCFSSDILSAVDQAVSDGVDVLSISLGGGVSSYFRDSLSVATFGAMERGVFVSCSAGNGGPGPVSLTNVAPWVATVGASTLDRDFPATVRLGSGRTLSGVSIYKGRMNLSVEKLYPVVYLGRTLDRKQISGKIVICDRGISPRVQKGQVVKEAGGIGMILANTAANGEELVADCHLLPAVAVGEKEGIMIKRYAMTTSNASATLSFLGTRLGIKPSPVVAAFSSRGPNILSLEILKPDVVAPGVNILAAWTGATGPSSAAADRRRVKFNILSGTSMSCPHVSGVAALIKSRHPEWSPAAIKSALMTTAYIHDNTRKPLTDAASGSPSSPYNHGAGHINPVRALNPGLVYDITPQEYFDFLCTQNPSPIQLKVFSQNTTRACKNSSLADARDLNYPALSVVFPQNVSITSLAVRRTVTNVGQPVSNYHVRVTPFTGAKVIVEPNVLNFTSKYQKLSYKVTFKTVSRQPGPEAGYLVWKDSVHRVRSPVILTWLPPI
ncbi:hypothetical protein Cgig2_025534 [Carnegiea gigantea]|uniref:Subtilisin-like protease SBT1.3 n=1 Tax=Carnegiea gigantea TaxID=171969 RepID=A0A9Q1QGY2_9CARY|nr:hypothetical protein Cgig2_025534 [Carnegiea gigantea]